MYSAVVILEWGKSQLLEISCCLIFIESQDKQTSKQHFFHIKRNQRKSKDFASHRRVQKVGRCERGHIRYTTLTFRHITRERGRINYGPPRNTQNFFKEVTTLIKIPFLGITPTTLPVPRCVKLLYKYANIY